MIKKKINIQAIQPKDAAHLIAKLDEYQIGLYGIEFCTLDSIDQLEAEKAFMLGAILDKSIVGMGAIKFIDGYAEVKRMYVEEEHRGNKIAELILTKLEEHALEYQIPTIYLETGSLHHAAMRFYERLGYTKTQAYGDYETNHVSVFYKKELQ